MILVAIAFCLIAAPTIAKIGGDMMKSLRDHTFAPPPGAG
jgi:hypothetical protein